MNKKIIFLSVAVSIMLIAVPNAEAKKGFYMGLGVSYNSIQGDFNGMGGLMNGFEIIILPHIDNAVGGNLFVGYGFNDAWAIELNWIGSDHSGTWNASKGDVSFAAFSINGKYTMRGSARIQPYLLFGLSGNAMTINDGAENTLTGQIGDATLSGSGLNLGVGIDTYITPKVSLNLGCLYRYIEYDEAEGIDNSGYIDKAIDGSGYSFLLTTAFHF